MYLHYESYVQDLLSKLPDFYKEYVYDDKLIRVLFDSFIDTAAYIRDYSTAVKNNFVVNTTELNHNDNIKVLELRRALYNVAAVAVKFEAEGNGNWFDINTPRSKKLAFLDKHGHYDLLSNSEGSSIYMDVLDAKLCKDFNGALGYYNRGEDYVINDSKIYVFNELAKPSIYGAETKQVLARDFIVEHDKLEKRWGVFIPEVKDDGISQAEYRSFLSSIMNYTPMISNMRLALNSLAASTISESATFRDLYSRKNLGIDVLTNPPQFGPFEFIYRIPSELMVLMSPDVQLTEEQVEAKKRVDNILSFLRVMKPSHTNFSLSGGMSIRDVWFASDTVSRKYSVRVTIPESLVLSDKPSRRQKTVFTDSIVESMDSFYDSGTYDLSTYDAEPTIYSYFSDAVSIRQL